MKTAVRQLFVLFLSVLIVTFGAAARKAGAQTENLPPGIQFVSEREDVREYRLANGMKLLLVQNPVAPVATVLVVYKVGSRNEAVGYTGSTHLLEHMMFKGTPTFNKDKNTQIAATLQRVGANYNANTWYDRTMYFETLPSDQIELGIKLEADRMRNSLIADSDRQSEMTVVRNELELGQNDPGEVLEESTYATAFFEHPYHHPTIGWRTDVEGVPTSRLKTFYDTFYYPNNSTAIIVGDFDRAKAIDLVMKYFGAIAPSPNPIPPVYTDEPKQQGERRFTIHRAGELAQLEIAYHAPGVLGQMETLSNDALAKRASDPPKQIDTYALMVLSNVLTTGVTSRLYQVLVEKQLAVTVTSNEDLHRDPGLFSIKATVIDGVDPHKVEAVIDSELGSIREKGLDEKEVDRARRQIIADQAFNRDGTFGIATQMAEAEAVANWRFSQTLAANIEKVTASDVQRVAKAYFNEDTRTVGYFLPVKPGAAPQGGTAPSGLKRGIQFYKNPRLLNSGPQLGVDDTSRVVDHPSRANTTVKENNRVDQAGLASKIVRSKLDTGSTLLVLANRSTPTIAFHASVTAGSYFDPKDKPGLSRLTAGMLERGTAKRTRLQIATDVESAGASIDYSPAVFPINIGGKAMAKDLPMIMQILAEELREPSFPADELDKLKQQTIAAIREEQQDTGSRAYERFTELVYERGYPFYKYSGDELIKSINSITVDDIRAFYKVHYGGRSLIMAVAGDVSAQDVNRLFKQAFDGWSGPVAMDTNVADIAGQTDLKQQVVVIKDKASVDIILGSAAPLRRSSPDFYAAMLANNALGESTLSSRLGLQVRDKEGLTYGIGSLFASPGKAPGPWAVFVSVNPANVRKAVDSSISVLRDYVKNGIRPDELADEKSSAIGTFKVALATNGGMAEAMLNAEFYDLGTDYIDRYADLISAVTLDQVNTAIRKYFQPDHLTIVAAGDIPAGDPLPHPGLLSEV